MITLLYIILTYALLGAITYLIAQHQIDEELTPFKQELFLLLGWIFKPVILIIMIIDSSLIPYIKYKKTIEYIKFKYDFKLFNPFLTKEERVILENKRDNLINLLTDVYYNWDSEVDEDEE